MAEANHVVHDGKLKKGSIVRLKSYQANEVKGKKLGSTHLHQSESRLIISGFL